MSKTSRPASRVSKTTIVGEKVARSSVDQRLSPQVSLAGQLVFGLFLLSLLTPLVYRTDVFFGYVSVRTLFFEGVITLMAVVSMLGSERTIRPTRLQWAMLGWLAVLTLTSALGVDPDTSFWSGFSRMEGVWRYAYLAIYSLVLTHAHFTSRQWTLALTTSVVVALVVVLVGYFSKSGWQTDDRLMATVGNASFLSVYLLMHVFVAALVALRYPNLSVTQRIIGLVVTGLILGSGILLTGSRSAVLAGGIGAGVLASLFAISYARSRPRVLIALVVGVAVLAGTYALMQTSETLQRIPAVYRLTHISGPFSTLQARQGSWQIAADAIAARPVFGWGTGNYTYGFALHYHPSFVLQGLPWYDRVHNMPLEWAFGGGLIGLLASLALWGMLLVRIWQRHDWLFIQKSVLAACLIAYFSFNLLNPDSLLPLQLFFLLLAFADSDADKITITNGIKMPMIARIGVALALIVGAYFTVSVPVQTLRQVNKQQAITDLHQRVDLLVQTYETATVGKMDVADYLVTLAVSVLNDSTFPSEGKTYVYEKAVKCWGEVCRKRPLSTRSATRMAALRLAHDDYPETFRIYQDALARERGQRPELFLQIGSAYLQQGKFENAMNAFRQAKQLEPHWETPLVYQALAYALHREPVRSDSLLRRISDAAILEELALVKQAYTMSGNTRGFVNRIMAVEFKHQFKPDVYVVWATAAFTIHDETALRTALNAFKQHYGGPFEYALIQEIIDDALLRNIPPAEGLQGLIGRLK